MVTSAAQDADFIRTVISTTLLEDAIAWIESNLSPEDVFDEKDLEAWALANGFKAAE